MNGFFKVPIAKNEPVRDYAPGSDDAKNLKAAIADLRSTVRDIPMYINGKEVRTGNTQDIFPPHDNKTKVGQFHVGTKDHVKQAIDSALAAKPPMGEPSLGTACGHLYESCRPYCRPLSLQAKCRYYDWAKQKCISGRNRCFL